jgi:hypothetical protein
MTVSAAIADWLLQQHPSLVVREASQSTVSSLKFHVSGCPETWSLKLGT